MQHHNTATSRSNIVNILTTSAPPRLFLLDNIGQHPKVGLSPMK